MAHFLCIVHFYHKYLNASNMKYKTFQRRRHPFPYFSALRRSLLCSALRLPKIFNVSERSTLLDFLALRLSKIFIFRFQLFFIVSKKSPFNLLFCKGVDVKKSRCLLFAFFGAMRRFRVLIFRLILGFRNIYPRDCFFDTIRFFDVLSEVKYYIRIFDVLSKLYCV